MVQQQRLPIRDKYINTKEANKNASGSKLRIANSSPRVVLVGQTNAEKGNSDNRDRKQSESNI